MPDTLPTNGLRKQERLCGKTSISHLLGGGKWGTAAHLRFCWISNDTAECNRIMVSVPKKYFKRAVKRNLLKRRMREAYRTQKSILEGKGIDMMFSWSSPQVADYQTIREEIASVMERISKSYAKKEQSCAQQNS